MLVALLTLLLLGGGSASDALNFIGDSRSEAKSVISDDDRRDAAMDLFKEMERHAKEDAKAVKKTIKAARKAIANQTEPEAEIEELWSEHFANAAKAERSMLDLRFDLKNEITRSEWLAIFGGAEGP